MQLTFFGFSFLNNRPYFLFIARYRFLIGYAHVNKLDLAENRFVGRLSAEVETAQAGGRFLRRAGSNLPQVQGQKPNKFRTSGIS